MPVKPDVAGRSGGKPTVPALLALAVASLLAGCGGENGTIRQVLPIVGLAYNDSVGPGDTLYLTVQYNFSNSCQSNATFEVQQLNDTTYGIVPVAVYPEDQACTGLSGTTAATLKVLGLGTGTRRFLVSGSNTILTANVHAGTAPQLMGYGFRLRVEHRTTGAPLPLAYVEIRDGIAAGDTLTSGLTDSTGTFVHERACDRPAFPYFLFGSHSGRTQNLYFRDPPARCGVPVMIVIRV